MAWSTIYNTKLIIFGWKASQLTGRTTSFSTCFPFKKKSHRNWKIETKTKKQGLWVFLHLTLPPVRSSTTREGKFQKSKKKSSANKSPPQKKKDPNHQTLPPKTQFCCWPFFGGIGDRKKSCLSKVVTTDLFPEPNLVMDREVPPMKPDAQQLGTLWFLLPPMNSIRDGKSGAPTEEILNSKKDAEFYAMISIVMLITCMAI